MKSIRAKLLLPFLVGLLLVTILLSLYTYNAAKEAVMGAAITVSKAKTDQIKNFLRKGYPFPMLAIPLIP